MTKYRIIKVGKNYRNESRVINSKKELDRFLPYWKSRSAGEPANAKTYVVVHHSKKYKKHKTQSYGFGLGKYM